VLLLNFIVYCIVTYTFFPLLSISRSKNAFLLNFKPIFRYRLLPYRPWESVGGTGWQGDQSSPRFWKFQHKTLFSWFRVGKNKFHPFWPPPLGNFWKNVLVPPHWKKLFPTPMPIAIWRTTPNILSISHFERFSVGFCFYCRVVMQNSSHVKNSAPTCRELRRKNLLRTCIEQRSVHSINGYSFISCCAMKRLHFCFLHPKPET